MSGLFGLNRRRLPADLRPRLASAERLVAWAGAPDGAAVVVTNFGLWLPAAEQRLGWHQIHKATWSGRQLAVVVAGEIRQTDEYWVMADLPPVVVTLLEPDRVPEQVRARINRSVAYTSHHPLPGGGGVRVVGRRVSGVDGLRWTVRFDAGVDAASTEITALTSELVAQARASVQPAD